MKLPELREILRQNKIKGYSHYNKKELVELLREKGLLPAEQPKPEKPKKEIDPRFKRLKTIRTNPKRVVLKSVETGDKITFPSIYKAAKSINQSPRIVKFWNGTVWNKKYEIRIDEHDSVMESIKNLEHEISELLED